MRAVSLFSTCTFGLTLILLLTVVGLLLLSGLMSSGNKLRINELQIFVGYNFKSLSLSLCITMKNYLLLLCMSSMQSLKRTSLFLSQKPSAS